MNESRLPEPTLPVGEVTLLFTDVEGSTRLWELHDDQMLELLGQHERIVAEAVAHSGGVLQLSRAEGDSSFAVFADPRAAIGGAVLLQRGMSGHPWPDGLRIRTRAALHTGSVELRGDTYYGPVVNRCVRLRALAHGGQTILSKATVDATIAAGGMPPDVTVTDLGTHRLKDLAVPERVYELCHPSLDTGFPPLRSPDVEKHNLPNLLGRFVGRRDVQRSVTKALGVERLVTLVGTGGVGKTRLALEVAWARVSDRTAPEPHDGTWFVNLTGARNEPDALGMMAAAIGVREQPGRLLIDTITDQLGDHATLVVLDNCEHVVSAVRPLVAALLGRCPNVRVLATSREALGVAGERRRSVPGLPLPEAIELFVDRAGLHATRADDGFAEAVARLCNRLDGIPLAIEIAAARASAIGPDAVERGVAQAQIEEAGRSVLEATLAWSHDLLDSDEQTLFRRLGVFAGQFSLSAAESVVVDDSLGQFDVLDLLDGLVQRSLVLRTDEGGYRQLFVVRECAARLAHAAGEFTDLAGSHLEWCLAFATSLRAPGLDERQRFDPLRQAGDDLLAALDRQFEGDFASAQVQLAGVLEEFWYLRGAFTEGRSHLETVLARGAGFRSHRAEVHRSAGVLARWQGDLEAAAQHLDASLALFREIVVELTGGDSPHLALFQHHVATTLCVLSEVALLRGNTSAAVAHASEALALPTPAVGTAALVLGLAEHTAGDLEAADSHFAVALRHAEDAGDESLLADFLRNLGVVARDSGDLTAAESYYRRALVLDRGSAREQILARTLLSLAELLVVCGGDAGAALDEGLALARALGDRQAEAHGLSTLAELTTERDVREAATLHRTALALRESIGTHREIALSQVRLATLADIAGHTDEAISLATSAADSFRNLADHRGVTEALAFLTGLHGRRGDLEAGGAALLEAIESSLRAPTVLERADLLDACAWLALVRRQHEHARAFLDAADRHRNRAGAITPAAVVYFRRDLVDQLGDGPTSDASEATLLDALLTMPV